MSERKFFGCLVGGFALLYLISFGIFYVPYYVASVENEIWKYVIEFATRLFKFVIPCLAASVLLSCCYTKIKTVLLRGLAIAAVSAVYNFLYYYLYFLAYGNDSIEGSLLALGAAALGVLVNYGYILLLYFVMKTISVKIISKDYLSALPPVHRAKPTPEMKKKADTDAASDIPAMLSEGKLFDLNSPVTAGIFAACFVQFAVMLLTETVSIVNYLVEYAGTYRTDEILYIVISLLFIFAELFLAHVLCYAVKNFIVKRGK